MKILFITPTLPSRLSRIRSYNILKSIYKRHEIHLLSFIDSEEKKKKIEDIREFCASVETVFLPRYRSYLNCLLYLCTPLPLRAAYYRSKKMRVRIRDILKREKFDLVYIKRKRLGQYGEAIHGIPKVLDLVDAMSMYYKRAIKVADIFRKCLYLEEYIKIRRYEIKLAKMFDKVAFCSPVDLEFLQTNSPEPLNNLSYIPH